MIFPSNGGRRWMFVEPLPSVAALVVPHSVVELAEGMKASAVTLNDFIL